MSFDANCKSLSCSERAKSDKNAQLLLLLSTFVEQLFPTMESDFYLNICYPMLVVLTQQKSAISIAINHNLISFVKMELALVCFGQKTRQKREHFLLYICSSLKLFKFRQT